MAFQLLVSSFIKIHIRNVVSRRGFSRITFRRGRFRCLDCNNESNKDMERDGLSGGLQSACKMTNGVGRYAQRLSGTVPVKRVL